jgi:NAD(P)H-hydrate epimerase
MKDKGITSAQMYKIEENGHEILGMKRLLMMENAGHGTADMLIRRFCDSLKSKRIVAVCGSGNNGGDAFVACRHLSAYGVENITALLLAPPKRIRTHEAKTNWRIISKMSSIKKVVIANGEKVGLGPAVEREIQAADVILDGLIGTGVKGGIKEPYSSVFDKINKSKAFVLAIDVPSGLDPDTGRPSNNCVKASATVTFHRTKIGLKNAKKYTGYIHIEPIGIPTEAEEGVLIK